MKLTPYIHLAQGSIVHVIPHCPYLSHCTVVLRNESDFILISRTFDMHVTSVYITKYLSKYQAGVEHVWNVMAHTQKPDLVFQRNGRVHLNWQGVSVQLTTGSRDVCISGSNGSNAGYTMFWGRIQDYWLPTPLACFPFTSPTVHHRVPSGFNWALLQYGWT